jgi:hypothetical protein
VTVYRQTIRDAVIEATPLARKYTLTSGSTTTAIDNQELLGPLPNSLVPRGAPVRVRDATTAGVYDDSFCDAYNPGTGQITLSPALAFTAAAGDTAEVWIPEIGHVKRVDEIIELALTEDCGAWVPFVLTLHTDGDMETATADVATYWLASGATLSKVAATGFPHRFARQMLFVDNTGAGGYAGTAVANYINVEPGDTYRISVMGRAAVSTLTLVVYDITNAAAITLESTAASTVQKQWVWLYSSFTIPTGCYQISVRLGGAAATADTYWTALSVLRVGDTRISLPARVTHMNNIGKVYQRLGSDVDSFHRGEEIEYDVEQVQNGYELILPSGYLGNTYPPYAEEWQNYPTIADDYTTATACDEEYARAHACRRLYQRLWEMEEKNHSGVDWANKWAQGLKQWRAVAVAMDTKHRGGYRPRLRFPDLATSQREI